MFYQAVYLYCDDSLQEILIAELSDLGFDSFENGDMKVLKAYMTEGLEIQENEVQEIINRYKKIDPALKYEIDTIRKENWNKTWEDQYEPIIVNNKILIKASFHDIQEPYETVIEINPKMSFGTGHHETTHLMLELLSSLSIDNRKVLDAGCGTGILAIFCALKSAAHVAGFDIDEWAVDNSKENVQLNLPKTYPIEIWQGDATSILQDKKYDLIIANINKNILLSDISKYFNHLDEKATLLLSGFYEQDVEDITMECERFGLKLKDQKIKNNWTALCFQM